MHLGVYLQKNNIFLFALKSCVEKDGEYVDKNSYLLRLDLFKRPLICCEHHRRIFKGCILVLSKLVILLLWR